MLDDIPGFQLRVKEESDFHRLLGFLSVWSWSRDEDTGERVYGYMNMTTVVGSTVWFPTQEYMDKALPWETLEHEWVHMKDARTFFSLLPFLPAAINSILFGLVYFLVLPWPGCFRAWAELRAYRRSLELVKDENKAEAIEHYVKQFTGPSYLFMWPFPKHVRKLLEKPSPYMEMMDGILA
jgi:hypothetical protein